VRFVVGGVDVYSIPTGRKGNGCADASLAHPQGQSGGIITRARRAAERDLLNGAETSVAELALLAFCSTQRGVSHQHSETLSLNVKHQQELPLVDEVGTHGGLQA
jgi:hypothetical protein